MSIVDPDMGGLEKLFGRSGQRATECPECHGAHAPLSFELAAYDPTFEWVADVQAYEQTKRYAEALAVLDKCMQVEEAHSGGVAPWCYEQAAIIHRKSGDRDAEIAVLRRFAGQPHSPGALPPKLLARLAKLESAG